MSPADTAWTSTRVRRIRVRLHGHDLLSDEFHIRRPPGRAQAVSIVKRPRIGVDYAGHWARRLLRFYEKGNPFVSRR